MTADKTIEAAAVELQESITDKLRLILGEEGVEILTEYVWHMLVSPKRSRNHIMQELQEFLAEETGGFVDWLLASVVPQVDAYVHRASSDATTSSARPTTGGSHTRQEATRRTATAPSEGSEHFSQRPPDDFNRSSEEQPRMTDVPSWSSIDHFHNQHHRHNAQPSSRVDESSSQKKKDGNGFSSGSPLKFGERDALREPSESRRGRLLGLAVQQAVNDSADPGPHSLDAGRVYSRRVTGTGLSFGSSGPRSRIEQQLHGVESNSQRRISSIPQAGTRSASPNRSTQAGKLLRRRSPTRQHRGPYDPEFRRPPLLGGGVQRQAFRNHGTGGDVCRPTEVTTRGRWECTGVPDLGDAAPGPESDGGAHRHILQSGSSTRAYGNGIPFFGVPPFQELGHFPAQRSPPFHGGQVNNTFTNQHHFRHILPTLHHPSPQAAPHGQAAGVAVPVGLLELQEAAAAQGYVLTPGLGVAASQPAPPALNSGKKLKKRCSKWPDCPFGDQCRYIHPAEMCNNWPHCPFGTSCFYIHPEVGCKFGLNCHNANCNYSHPEDWDPTKNMARYSFHSTYFQNKTLNLAATRESSNQDAAPNDSAADIVTLSTPADPSTAVQSEPSNVLPHTLPLSTGAFTPEPSGTTLPDQTINSSVELSGKSMEMKD